MPRVIFNGTAGERWENDTGKVQYQFHASLINTCGVCLQYHLAISAWWPIPIHRGCRCYQTLVIPDAKAEPFVDFRKLLDGMAEDQKQAAIGKAAYRLLKRGVVPWEEIVTPSRVRTLEEIVSRRKLSIKVMTKAGIKPQIATRAYKAVNTPAHQIIQAHRKSLVANLQQAGLTDQQIKQAVGERVAQRVGIAAGPSGPQKLPVPVTPLPVLIPFLGLNAARVNAALALKPRPRHENPTIDRFLEITHRSGAPVKVIEDEKEAIKRWGILVDFLPAAYNWKENMILLNAHALHWKDPSWFKEDAEEGYFSGSDVDHTAHHETAHFKHAQTIGPEAFGRMAKRVLKSAEKIAREVSGYAATSVVEFVAEVYAGAKIGKTYSKSIMSLYRKLKGPKP